MRFKVVPALPDAAREEPAVAPEEKPATALEEKPATAPEKELAGALALLARARDAVPLVPRSEDDCCMRVVNAGVAGARDDASEWLTFARALGLVAESDRGYHRVRDAPDPTETAGRTVLADRFRERVFGAEELLAALDAAGGLTADAAFDRFRDRVPNWERRRHTDTEAVWRERVGHLLDWAVVLGLARWDNERYRAA
jgi:hypothetical protein